LVHFGTIFSNWIGSKEGGARAPYGYASDVT